MTLYNTNYETSIRPWPSPRCDRNYLVCTLTHQTPHSPPYQPLCLSHLQPGHVHQCYTLTPQLKDFYLSNVITLPKYKNILCYIFIWPEQNMLLFHQSTMVKVFYNCYHLILLGFTRWWCCFSAFNTWAKDLPVVPPTIPLWPDLPWPLGIPVALPMWPDLQWPLFSWSASM